MFRIDRGRAPWKVWAKAREGIFFGYSMESKEYKVYVIDQKKLIESINVTFDDDNLPSQ